MSDDGPKLVHLPDKNEMKAAGDALRRQLPAIMDNARLIAQIRRASYIAHVEQGFTEAQALELCKSMSL